MSVNTVSRQKFQRLMTRIDELEELIDALERQPPAAAGRGKLRQWQEELAGRRLELQRLSDGCGVPHGQNL